MTRNQPPYFLVPQAPTGSFVRGPYPVPPPAPPPSSIAQAVSSLSTAANNLASSSSAKYPTSSPTNSFKAPAHKHAHHLHSIPPREKSTRTLIIDHMLWVHGRTRFAQARAELGMTDRTGGPTSSTYIYRQRPENYEEEDDVGSEGEDVVRLKARAGDPHNEDEDERLRSQDLVLARNLRLRAESLEKVITSMLDQPPTVHPIHDEDILTCPTSPKLHPSNQREPPHPHTLPNGVRLRLALGTVINDLFARQAPTPPYRPQHRTTSLSEPSTSSGNPSTNSNLVTSTLSTFSNLPTALNALSTISAPLTELRNSMSVTPGTSGSFQPGHVSNTVQRKSPLTPSLRTRSLYTAGADLSSVNMPPVFRCPRHLHTGCEICVEAKSSGRPGVGSARGKSNTFGPGDFGTRGINQSNSWKGTRGRVEPGDGGISGWQDGSGIGSGLARAGVGGSVLRRKPVVWGGEAGTRSGNTKLSELIPRFIRLSALVAMELGSEAREEEEQLDLPNSKEIGGTDTFPSKEGWAENNEKEIKELPPLSGPPSPSTTRALARPQSVMYAYALRPSSEWYMLLAGLLTRAVLEGYLTAGWTGLEAVECLLTVGTGTVDANDETGKGKGRRVEGDEDVNGDLEEFDPDELPSLFDAVRILFPASRSGSPLVKGPAEQEFEIEMDERLRRFYDIPSSAPDLSTHMEDLAWQYPAEPVERAAARFCEAIAKWRGKPELETYKKKPPQPSQSSYINDTSSNSTMTIESLVHSYPISPTTGNAVPSGEPTFDTPSTRKPSIESYFTQPLAIRDNAWNRNKRTRSPDDSRGGASKRVHG